MNKHHPYHPIIYVRGFAATHSEIEETVADPYIGFNVGSTKTRAVWSGDLKRFYFESPLVRLMSEHYDDAFVEGEAGSWFARKRSTLGAALVFTAPGIPMIFQGQEFLEDRYFRDSAPWIGRSIYRCLVDKQSLHSA